MPEYTYVCCENFTVNHSYKIKKKKCPKCGKLVEDRLIYPPIVARVQEIRTVGQQGEANYKRDKNKIQELKEMKEENGQNKRTNKS